MLLLLLLLSVQEVVVVVEEVNGRHCTSPLPEAAGAGAAKGPASAARSLPW